MPSSSLQPILLLLLLRRRQLLQFLQLRLDCYCCCSCCCYCQTTAATNIRCCRGGRLRVLFMPPLSSIAVSPKAFPDGYVFASHHITRSRFSWWWHGCWCWWSRRRCAWSRAGLIAFAECCTPTKPRRPNTRLQPLLSHHTPN